MSWQQQVFCCHSCADLLHALPALPQGPNGPQPLTDADRAYGWQVGQLTRLLELAFGHAVGWQPRQWTPVLPGTLLPAWCCPATATPEPPLPPTPDPPRCTTTWARTVPRWAAARSCPTRATCTTRAPRARPAPAHRWAARARLTVRMQQGCSSHSTGQDKCQQCVQTISVSVLMRLCWTCAVVHAALGLLTLPATRGKPTTHAPACACPGHAVAAPGRAV